MSNFKDFVCTNVIHYLKEKDRYTKNLEAKLERWKFVMELMAKNHRQGYIVVCDGCEYPFYETYMSSFDWMSCSDCHKVFCDRCDLKKFGKANHPSYDDDEWICNECWESY